MILDRLRGLSAAEEFFAALGVAFDQKALDVHRLHILKRFNEYLAKAGAKAGAEPDEAACRGCLEQAYRDYAEASGPVRKSFKVFRQAEAAKGFVPLDALLRK
jgi:nitrogenase-stabilizing/protective protein